MAIIFQLFLDSGLPENGLSPTGMLNFIVRASRSLRKKMFVHVSVREEIVLLDFLVSPLRFTWTLGPSRVYICHTAIL